MEPSEHSASTGSKSPRPRSGIRSTSVSSGPDSATLETIQSLQKQIADLEAKETERGDLTKSQADKLAALESELAALKAATANTGKPASTGEAASPDGSPQSETGGRLAPWCPW